MLGFLIPSLAAGLLLFWLEPGWWKAMRLGLLLPAFFGLTGLALSVAARVHPLTYDLQLAALDQMLGVPSFEAIQQSIVRFPAICTLAFIAYQGVPIWFALVIHDRRDSMLLIWKLATASVVGFAVYQLVPACGPAYVHYGHVVAGRLWLPLNFPRNCMPSLHFTWVLLIWANRKPWQSQWRVLTWMLLLFTGLATLATGEHYAIDLLAAIPFTFAISSAVEAKADGSREFPTTFGSIEEIAALLPEPKYGPRGPYKKRRL